MDSDKHEFSDPALRKDEGSDLRNTPKNILREFILTYKAHPSLWQIKNKSVYNNRSLKMKGYKALLAVWRKTDSSADIKDVKQKIQSLRGSFRKEMKKVISSRRSGCGPDDVYTSHLWYFGLMSFLLDQDVLTDSTDNTGELSDTTISQDFLETEIEESQDSRENEVEEAEIFTTRPKKLLKRWKTEDETRQFMTACAATLNAKTNESEAFGNLVGIKFSAIKNAEQRMLAEALILRTIMKATQNKLTESTTLADI